MTSQRIRHLLSLPLAVIPIAAGLALAVVMMHTAGSAYAQTTPLQVGVGVGKGTQAGDAYTPGEFTVATGTSVTFSVNSDEPHTVTFGAGPTGTPPDQWPVTGFTAPPPGPPGPVDLGSTNYDGTGFVNTGLLFGGSKATVDFTTAGDFPFSCAIHPGMAGTVHVVAAGGDTTTQAEADAAAKQTEDLINGQVATLQASAAASVTSETQSNGTKLWKIHANAKNDPAAMPGGGTGYLELQRFIPDNVSISAGDTVQWTASAVHTVTFLKPGQDPATLGDPFAVAPAKPSDSYDGTSLYNSGVLAAGPGAPTTFQLTFPKAGTFPYLCLIHGSLGQTGTVTVAAVTQLPNTGGPVRDGGTDPLLPLAGGMLLLTLAAGAFVTLRRMRSS